LQKRFVCFKKSKQDISLLQRTFEKLLQNFGQHLEFLVAKEFLLFGLNELPTLEPHGDRMV
jgi:hypothetical protein